MPISRRRYSNMSVSYRLFFPRYLRFPRYLEFRLSSLLWEPNIAWQGWRRRDADRSRMCDYSCYGNVLTALAFLHGRAECESWAGYPALSPRVPLKGSETEHESASNV